MEPIFLLLWFSYFSTREWTGLWIILKTHISNTIVHSGAWTVGEGPHREGGAGRGGGGGGEGNFSVWSRKKLFFSFFLFFFRCGHRCHVCWVRFALESTNLLFLVEVSLVLQKHPRKAMSTQTHDTLLNARAATRAKGSGLACDLWHLGNPVLNRLARGEKKNPPRFFVWPWALEFYPLLNRERPTPYLQFFTWRRELHAVTPCWTREEPSSCNLFVLFFTWTPILPALSPAEHDGSSLLASSVRDLGYFLQDRRRTRSLPASSSHGVGNFFFFLQLSLAEHERNSLHETLFVTLETSCNYPFLNTKRTLCLQLFMWPGKLLLIIPSWTRKELSACNPVCDLVNFC